MMSTMDRVLSSPTRSRLIAAALLAFTLSVTPRIDAATAWRPTNLAALHTHPEFFQGRPIAVDAILSRTGEGRLLLTSGAVQVQVLYDGPPVPDGLVEVRGEFWNIGGMQPDDPRIASAAIQRRLGLTPTTPWPRSGALLVIHADGISPASPPATTTLRTIVLDPSRYLDRHVTIAGQFSGRNLLGELPDAPGRSPWDFVLRADHAALWVTGERPKGAGFDLSLDNRVDTEHWLEVSGVVQQARGLIWIEAAKGGIRDDRPPAVQADAGPAAAPPPAVAPFPPPEVIFSVPTQGQSDVPLSTAVRIQFSRDIDPATFAHHVEAGYLLAESVRRGEPQPPAVSTTLHYFPDRRELEILFSRPLERFRTVKVTLLPGILGTDHQPLKPWTLTFVLGGS